MPWARVRVLLIAVVLLGTGASGTAGCGDQTRHAQTADSGPGASTCTGANSATSTASCAATDTGTAVPTTPVPATDAAIDAGTRIDAGLGTNDAALPGMTAGTGCASASLCDSFETGAASELDANAWTIGATNCSGTGEVAIDGDVAHSGARSVRVRGGAGYCNHVFFTPKLNAAPLPDPLHVRFFVRFDMPLGAAHVTFLALHDASEDKDLRMGGQSEVLIWNRESDDATLPELSPTGIAASVKPIARTWLCVELELSANRSAPALRGGASPEPGELHTFIDGKPVVALSSEGDPTPDGDAQWQRKADWRPQPTDVRLGWESYGDQANTLWFDDVAIGNARFGCDN